MSIRNFSLNHAAPTLIYTLSLHDALPISAAILPFAITTVPRSMTGPVTVMMRALRMNGVSPPRSEEHTSELQSRENLVCRHLLEKKNGENSNVVASVPSLVGMGSAANNLR